MNRIPLTALTLLFTLSHQAHGMEGKPFYSPTPVKALHSAPVHVTMQTGTLPPAPMCTTTCTGTGSGSGSGSSSPMLHDIPQLSYDQWNHRLSLYGGERTAVSKEVAVASRVSKRPRLEISENTTTTTCPHTPQSTATEPVSVTTTPCGCSSQTLSCVPLLRSGFSLLPNELVDKIFESMGHISPLAMTKLQRVCRAWRQILDAEKYDLKLDISAKKILDQSDDVARSQNRYGLNHLIDEATKHRGEACKVHVLNCSYNTNINGPILTKLVATFPHLEELVMSGCTQIASRAFYTIVDLTKLKRLDVSDTNIDATALGRIIAKMPELNELNLYECTKLHAAEFGVIATLAKLKKLNVSRTHINASSLEAIVANNPDIEELVLESCGCLGKPHGQKTDFGSIAKHLKNLKKLDVSRTDVHDADLRIIIAHLPHIEDLNLAGCREIHYAHELISAIAALNNLKKLDVSYTEINHNALLEIVANNPNLEELNIGACYDLFRMGNDFGAIAAHLKNLKKLVFYFACINKTTLRTIAAHIPGLEELELNSCNGLFDDIFDLDTDFGEIVARLSKLKKLSVTATNINGATLGSIAVHVPWLEDLSLYKCTQIESNDLSILGTMKNLTKLDVRDSGLDETALDIITTHIPWLKELSIFGRIFGRLTKLEISTATTRLKNLEKLF